MYPTQLTPPVVVPVPVVFNQSSLVARWRIKPTQCRVTHRVASSWLRAADIETGRGV